MKISSILEMMDNRMIPTIDRISAAPFQYASNILQTEYPRRGLEKGRMDRYSICLAGRIEITEVVPSCEQPANRLTANNFLQKDN